MDEPTLSLPYQGQIQLCEIGETEKKPECMILILSKQGDGGVQVPGTQAQFSLELTMVVSFNHQFGKT